MTRPAPLSAGDHPAPLDLVHEELGEEGLLRHLAADHHRPVSRHRGPAVAQAIHTRLHEAGR